MRDHKKQTYFFNGKEQMNRNKVILHRYKSILGLMTSKHKETRKSTSFF